MKRDGISGRGVQRGKPVGTPPIPLPLPRSDPSVPALWGYRGQQEPLCLPLMGSQSCQEMLMHSRQSSLMVPELKREAPSRQWDSLDRAVRSLPGLLLALGDGFQVTWGWLYTYTSE